MSSTPSPTASANRIVVGFKDRSRSLAALRWAIDAAGAGALPLTVVHATDVGVSVRNGPSSSIAHQLGSPLWATVFSLVQGLAAPDGTEVIVESGEMKKVLAKHTSVGDVVVLGNRSRWHLGPDLKEYLEQQCGCSVLRVGHLDIVGGSPALPQVDGLARRVGSDR